jgi:hypothetical protein
LSIAVKLGLGAALIGLLFWVGNKAHGISSLLNSLTFKLLPDAGLPRLNGSILSIPLVARITNSTNKSLAIDRLQVIISYLNANNVYVPASQANLTGFTIVPGTIDKPFTAQADIQAITKNLFNNALTVLVNRGVKLKIDVTPTIAGATLPTQSVFQVINV